jgi:hypothetical protein
MVSFDPYLNWLGIAPHEQPPNFYRLLGVVLFESSPHVIEQAADQQSLRVGAYQSGPQGEMCQRLLSEIAMARFCLLDSQQKAAYDGQLMEGLAQRGERSVAAPPPPGAPGGGRQLGQPAPQFGPPLPQFGAPAGIDPNHSGNGMPGPMTMPGPPPPMRSPMPAGPAMPGSAPMPMAMPSSQPMMPMPSMPMSAPTGFPVGMPHPPAPAALPVAAPFPTATLAVVARPAAAPAAPPASPPAAPQRPIDELEILTSQAGSRRHSSKKRKKEDYTPQIIIGSVVAAAGVLLFIVYIAVTSQVGPSHGFDKVADDIKEPESPRAKLAEKLRQEVKEAEKQKQAAAARPSPSGGKVGRVRPSGTDVRQANQHSSGGDDGDMPLPSARNFGPPTRSMDSPAQGGPVQPAPQPDGHDTPQDLGSDKDPVLDKDELEHPNR